MSLDDRVKSNNLPGNTAWLVPAMCAAEMLSMAGTFSFPSLLPVFLNEWNLSHSQAGWINGAYFAGYALAVPVLAGLTDKTDARRIFLISACVGAGASLGFALFAQGFYSALFFRIMAGLGLAGTFIPGLKAVVDRIERAGQARAVSFYTATFGLGISLSFFASGKLESAYGWRWAFGLAAAGAVLAVPIAARVLKPITIKPVESRGSHILDFRPVLKNRLAMAYILAYAAHMWEMFTFRSLVVAFLTFSLSLKSSSDAFIAPTTVAALAGIIAMMANVGGAELALKFGLRKVLTLIMMASGLIGCFIGFLAALPYAFLAMLCIVYSSFLQADSAALHTGIIQAAEPERMGVTMAFQSLLGFAAASIGPLVVGSVIDFAGEGKTVFSWGAGFVVMGLGVMLGPVFIRIILPGKTVK